MESEFQDYYDLFRQDNKEKLDKILNELDAAYAKGETILPDEVYDHLVKIFEHRFGERNVVGSLPEHNKVKLPIAMMSLDKVMKEKQLNNFINKYNKFVLMDKINGNAGLYQVKYNPLTKKSSLYLYNRGNGTIGTDLTYLLPYLKLPVPKFDLLVKGEFIIFKKDYNQFREDYKTNLVMVNGIINSLDADPAKLSLLRFIAYDVIFPSNPEIQMSISQILKYLSESGFVIPTNVERINDNQISIENLSQRLHDWRNRAPYEIDGIVITADIPIPLDWRYIYENPDYSVAFKEYENSALATVERIEWEASKNSLLKPVVIIDPVIINGVTIKRLTAFNGAWIRDNNVGPGSELLITHNTIPYILEVIRPTEAQLPNIGNNGEILEIGKDWEWNESGVEIVLLEETDEVKIMKLYEFCKQLGVKYAGQSLISKFYEAGFNTIKKLVESKKEDFIRQIKNMPGVGEKKIDTFIENLNIALLETSLPELMSASGTFGIGFGAKKIKMVTDVYPNILSIEPTIDKLKEIQGFGEKTAERFVNGLPKFKAFLKDIPRLKALFEPKSPKVSISSPKVSKPIKTIKIQPRLQPRLQPRHEPPEEKPVDEFLSETTNKFVRETANEFLSPSDARMIEEDNSMEGVAVVFTGFRDKALEREIVSRGGEVKTSVSRKVTYVISGGGKDAGTTKENKAREYGIPIISLAEFKRMYKL